jgi:hypothetical protein
MREQIALRNGFVCLSTDFLSGKTPKQTPDHVQVIQSTQAELMKLGYMLSPAAVDSLNQSSTESVIKFHDKVIAYLLEMLGAKKSYKPFYVNFPTQVMEMSIIELYMNAIVHYWSDGLWEPAQELNARGVKFEHTSFKILKPVAGDDWLREIAVNLASFPKPLDKQKLADLIWIAHNIKNVEVGKITVRETLCELAAAGIDVKISTPTDLLRVATRLSGGDVSLPVIPRPNRIPGGWRTAAKKREAEVMRAACKFKKFNRAQRKFLLGMLESLPIVDPSEMQVHLGRWLRLGEILHPGEYANKFPKAFAAFNAIRNQQETKVRTFAGKVEIGLMKSMKDGVEVLKTRPGEFARRLDSLVRTYGDTVLPHFESVADRVSSKVIFEMFDHFEGRLKEKTRSVMLKGHGAKMSVLEPLPALPKKTVAEIQRIVLNTMKKKFAKMPEMDKVFISEELKMQPVPFSMQSSSDGLSVQARGTRFKFNENANTLRGFVHWDGTNKPIDIDLSAAFLDENFVQKGVISYYSLTNSELRACHSGDVRHRRGSCAEYIDVPLADAIKCGVRYVIFNLYNYDRTSFNSVPECTFGVMERKHPSSNEIFEPQTIANAIKVQANSNVATPIAFDLLLNQWIWIDLEHSANGIPNLATDKTTIEQFKAILGGSKLSVYDLLLLHVEARGGELVSDPSMADEVFTAESFSDYSKLTPYMAV